MSDRRAEPRLPLLDAIALAEWERLQRAHRRAPKGERERAGRHLRAFVAELLTWETSHVR